MYFSMKKWLIGYYVRYRQYVQAIVSYLISDKWPIRLLPSIDLSNSDRDILAQKMFSVRVADISLDSNEGLRFILWGELCNHELIVENGITF